MKKTKHMIGGLGLQLFKFLAREEGWRLCSIT